MHAILSIYHRKCSCQHNLKLCLVLLFIEAVTICRSATVNIYANDIILLSQLFAFAFTSTETQAIGFPVLFMLKPRTVTTFCRLG